MTKELKQFSMTHKKPVFICFPAYSCCKLYNNNSGGHVVVALEKTDEYITFTDSGTTQKVYWGGLYLRSWLEKQPGYSLYTRYPE